MAHSNRALNNECTLKSDLSFCVRHLLTRRLHVGYSGRHHIVMRAPLDSRPSSHNSLYLLFLLPLPEIQLRLTERPRQPRILLHVCAHRCTQQHRVVVRLVVVLAVLLDGLHELGRVVHLLQHGFIYMMHKLKPHLIVTDYIVIYRVHREALRVLYYLLLHRPILHQYLLVRSERVLVVGGLVRNGLGVASNQFGVFVHCEVLLAAAAH